MMIDFIYSRLKPHKDLQKLPYDIKKGQILLVYTEVSR